MVPTYCSFVCYTSIKKMTSYNACTDELLKIATGYTEIGTLDQRARLISDIPVISKLSKKPERARARLEQILKSGKGHAVLGYKNIAVHEKNIPSLKDMGFNSTSIGVPLPGEKVLSTTWRSGKLHAHKIGPVFLMHLDKTEPSGLKSIKHVITEGIPAIVRRMKETQALVKEVKE